MLKSTTPHSSKIRRRTTTTIKYNKKKKNNNNNSNNNKKKKRRRRTTTNIQLNPSVERTKVIYNGFSNKNIAPDVLSLLVTVCVKEKEYVMC